MAFMFLKDCLKKEEEYATETVYNLKYFLSGPLKNICEHLLKKYIYIVVVVAVYPLISCFSAVAKAFHVLHLIQKQNSFYCGFNLCFLDLWCCCTSSHIWIGYLNNLLLWILLKPLACFSIWLFAFLLICRCNLSILDISYLLYVWQIFSPTVWLDLLFFQWCLLLNKNF